MWPAAALAQGEGPEAPAPRPRLVKKIRFRGNRRYTDEFLKEQISTKEGQEYDPGLIVRDERVLREYFAAVVDIEEEEVEDGLVITIHVVDKVVVGKVVFQGLTRVQESDLKPLMATRAGRPLLEHALESDRKMIERLHREKGYHFAEVRYYRRETRKRDVQDVLFQVFATRRVRVKEVILEGVHSIKPRELKKIVKNSDRYRKQLLGLGKLLNPKYYDRAAVDEDRRRIQLYYEREGYRDVKVVYVGTRFDEKRKYATIKYRIEEGARYKLAAFAVEFAKDGLPEERDRAFLSVRNLEALSRIRPGQPFRTEDMARTRREISERLWSRAYANSRIEERVVSDSVKHTVSIRFVITCGPRIRMGRLRFFGNKWTKDNVLRRAARRGALPGEAIDIESLEAMRTRLLATRFFSLVRFGDGLRPYGLVKPPDAPADVRDVEVEVEEADTRQFSIGAGVSTDGGAFGNLSISWRNFDIGKPPDRLSDFFAPEAFRGAGQSFTISLAPGTTFSSFRIAFSDPAVRDSRWSLGVTTFRSLAFFDDYDLTTDGIRVSVGRFLDENFVYNLSFSWYLRQVLLDDPDITAPVNALDQQGTSALHGAGVSLTRRRRKEADAFLNGHVTTVSLEFYGGPLGADIDILKLTLDHRTGLRVFRSEAGGWHRILFRFTVNHASAFDDTPEVPIYERYFLGGRNLRGFEFREVGPRSNNSPTGGEFMMTLSTQYTVPLVSRDNAGFALDLVFFIDQGGIEVDMDDFSGDDWRISAGFGFAIGFGGPTQPPLLVDFGWPLREQAADRSQVVSIAFQRNF